MASDERTPAAACASVSHNRGSPIGTGQEDAACAAAAIIL